MSSESQGDAPNRVRKVARSRADRGVAGKRRAPTPGRTVAKAIGATLLTLAMATGFSVVLIYNHWNGNIDHKDVSAQLHNRPAKKESGPLNILVMGSDTRDCDGCNIDGMTE